MPVPGDAQHAVNGRGRNDGACSVANCGSPAAARGYCYKHYKRWQLYGDVHAIRRPSPRNKGFACAVEECESGAATRGYCNKHYQRWRRHGDPHKVAQPQTADSPLCVVEGCEGEHEARGYCNKHYQRWQRHGDPYKMAGYPLCVVEGCEGGHRARGFCAKHYARWRTHGDPHIKSSPQRVSAGGAPLCREDYGSRIRAARLAAGLTQWTVAGWAGVSMLTVSQVERGHRTNPRFSTLKGFAGALGIPLSELLARPNSTALENELAG